MGGFANGLCRHARVLEHRLMARIESLPDKPHDCFDHVWHSPHRLDNPFQVIFPSLAR
jgi:hypothetical protein